MKKSEIRVLCALLVGFVVCCVFVFKNTPASTQDASTSQNSQQVPTTAQPVQAAPAAPVTSENKPADHCKALLARFSEIDNGATKIYMKPPTGPIRKVDNPAKDKEYDELKDCWREGNSKPDLSDVGMLISPMPIKLGMTWQELSNMLPMAGWALEKCKTDYPANDKSSNEKMGCMFFNRALTEQLRGLGITSPNPTILMVRFDGVDGKLLGWSLDHQFPVNQGETTSDVIRLRRRDHLELLGPPDKADEASAGWYFVPVGGTKALESVSLQVRRDGQAFDVHLNVDDDEHEYPIPAN